MQTIQTSLLSYIGIKHVPDRLHPEEMYVLQEFCAIWGMVLLPEYNMGHVWRIKTGEGVRKLEGATKS
jgi:hypothetical protein